ncbi:MAG: diphthamide synthesis protein [Nanoarchaeota archaeon]|nr:diphthamide synthesis protein [Nanoarchaeota archaeon]MBU1703968.1 diphthamide synthesis protein [Nanoarchaeota archaeon]
MYDLELEKAVDAIRKEKPKTVLIQLPEGLKPKAQEIVDKIEAETGIKPLIWMGTCFGACDTPEFKADLLIQWGHSRFVK